MAVFRWGIFGTGAISANFVSGLAAAPGHRAVMVASRTKAKAEWFASGTRIESAVEGYAEAASTAKVDAIYIATPPAEHVKHALMCIEAGLPVLVEKPFASSADDASLIIKAARAQGVFAMEAMWTRFMPAARAFRECVLAGAVGEARMVSGNFGISKRLDLADGSFDPARGGGAIAQLGVYPLSLAQWLFGAPEAIQATGRVGETGVEEEAAFQLRYPADVTGSFFCSIRAWTPNDFTVMGTEGLTAFRGPLYRPSGIELARQAPQSVGSVRFDLKTRLLRQGLALRAGQWMGTSTRSRATKVSKVAFAGNGYHYQAQEVAACLARGDLESAIMPLSDSVSVAETAGTIRAAIKFAAMKRKAL